MSLGFLFIFLLAFKILFSPTSAAWFCCLGSQDSALAICTCPPVTCYSLYQSSVTARVKRTWQWVPWISSWHVPLPGSAACWERQVGLGPELQL